LWLLRQHKYIFRYPENHPFRISLTEDGTHGGGGEWLNNITHTVTTGPIQEFEFIPITGVYTTLYYYCANHSGMGNSISIVMDGKFFDLGNANINYDITGSHPTLEFEQLREGGTSAQESMQVTLTDSIVDAEKDGDDIKFTTICGDEITVGPFSGAAAGYNPDAFVAAVKDGDSIKLTTEDGNDA